MALTRTMLTAVPTVTLTALLGGADPDAGDLGYHTHGNDLVLYHGDQSFLPGIVILGRMHRDAAERIADMGGSVTATVAAR